MKQSTVAEKNKGLSLARERLVVVGGTQGIGEGIACRFAAAGAEVWIVGRNESKAKGVLEKLRASSAKQKIDPPPEHAFLQADLSLVSEAKRIAGDLRNRAGSQGIDYLVMCQGGPPNGTFTITSEDYDQHFAVQVLSRFIIAHELAGDPASSTVKKAVMSVMAPARNSIINIKFNKDDIDLRKANAEGRYGLFMAVNRDSHVVDAFTDDLTKKNPNVNFMHVFPGAVKTEFARNSAMPWYWTPVLSLGLMLAGSTPLQYAEIPLYLLAHPEGREVSARDKFTTQTLARVEHPAIFRDESARDKICGYLSEILG